MSRTEERIMQAFAALNDAGSKYLLVGGLASILHGVPRTTTDLDIQVACSKREVAVALKALKGIGLVPDTDDLDDVMGQGGVSLTNDISVDVIADLPYQEFGRIWSRRKKVKYLEVYIPVVSKPDLVKMLKRVARPQDLEDLKILVRSDRRTRS